MISSILTSTVISETPNATQRRIIHNNGHHLINWTIFVILLTIVIAQSSDSETNDNDCPSLCSCLGSFVDCSKRGLSHVPHHLPQWCEILELSHNLIDKISNNTFDGLINLRKLDLSHNQLKHLDPHLFSDSEVPKNTTPPIVEIKLNNNFLSEFPQMYGLSQLTTIILNHNNIHSLSNAMTHLYPNLTTIDLNSNRIANFPIGLFNNGSKINTILMNNNRIISFDRGSFDNLTSLEVLKLSKNRLLTLPKEVLRKLNNLKELDLSRNRLSQIEGLTFHGLESLETLKLKRNELSQLLDGAFWGLSNIQYLHLDHNNLTKVRKGWLYGLTSLKQLTLSHNNIDEIDGDGWEFARKLWELDLTYNNIESVTKDTFSRFHSLQYLYLDFNRISYIEEGAFRSMSALEILNLNHNEISWTIEDSNGAFMGLDRVAHLGLAHNHIKSIAKRTFNGITRLRTLDLTHNPITSIQDQSFTPLKNLQELRLNSTDLLCDCTLKWLPLWLKNTSQSTNRHMVADAKCKHPKWLMGKSLLKTNPEDFTCEDFPKPYITEEPKKDDNPIIALRGNNMTLTCKAASSSSADMQFQWLKDSQLLVTAAIVKNRIDNYGRVSNGTITEFTSILTLQHIDDNDEGRYQCIVSNPFGTVYSQKVRINVHVMPVFTKTPSNVTVKVGNTARLECSAKGHPMPEIAWQKDGGDDFPAARERRIHVMFNDDVFFIMEVKVTDMGQYTCTATNAAGVITANSYVNVLEMPTFVRPMYDKETISGETAVLECMASGSPKPVLTWTKDNGQLIATERHFFTADNQLLIIVKTQLSDNGEYICEMSNILGSVSDSSLLTILPLPNEPVPEETANGSIFPDTKLAGIIIIAVCICVVATSLVWVVIIYQTRKRGEDYAATNTDDTTIPGELDSFSGIITSGSGCAVRESMPNVFLREMNEDDSFTHSKSSTKDSGTGDSSKHNSDELLPDDEHIHHLNHNHQHHHHHRRSLVFPSLNSNNSDNRCRIIKGFSTDRIIDHINRKECHNKSCKLCIPSNGKSFHQSSQFVDNQWSSQSRSFSVGGDFLSEPIDSTQTTNDTNTLPCIKKKRFVPNERQSNACTRNGTIEPDGVIPTVNAKPELS